MGPVEIGCACIKNVLLTYKLIDNGCTGSAYAHSSVPTVLIQALCC